MFVEAMNVGQLKSYMQNHADEKIRKSNLKIRLNGSQTRVREVARPHAGCPPSFAAFADEGESRHPTSPLAQHEKLRLMDLV